MDTAKQDNVQQTQEQQQENMDDHEDSFAYALSDPRLASSLQKENPPRRHQDPRSPARIAFEKRVRRQVSSLAISILLYVAIFMQPLLVLGTLPN
jgi:hypothetical protein